MLYLLNQDHDWTKIYVYYTTAQIPLCSERCKMKNVLSKESSTIISFVD